MKTLKTYEQLFENNQEYHIEKVNILITDRDIEGVQDYINNNEFDINQKTKRYNTLLYVSCNSSSQIVKILLDAGADPNISCGNYATRKKLDGYVPLMNCRIDVIEKLGYLTDAGANWNYKNYRNKDFFDYISKEQAIELIEMYPEKYEQYLMKKTANDFNL